MAQFFVNYRVNGNTYFGGMDFEIKESAAETVDGIMQCLQKEHEDLADDCEYLDIIILSLSRLN